jgi:putative phosphoesterase
MKIGILGDSHGRIETVKKALSEFRERSVEVVIHCGDIDDSATVDAFYGWKSHFVFGNCDVDRAGIRQAIARIGGTLHDSFGHLELAGKLIAWLHGDDPALKRELEQSGHYDYLFFGHSHVAEQYFVGKTLVVNPGALFRARQKTCAVLDLPGGAIETILIAQPNERR